MIDNLAAMPKLSNPDIDIISLHRMDEGLTILYINPGMQKVLGYTVEEMVGTSVIDYIDGNDVDRVSNLTQWITPDLEYTGQIRIQTKTCSWIWMEVKALLLPGKDNGPEILLLSRDITSQRSPAQILRKQDERYRAIVEDQTELICRFLPSTKITFVNEAFCRYFRKSREDLIDSSCLELIIPENREKNILLLRMLTKDNPVITFEQQILDGDRNLRWLQITNRAIFDDKVNFIEYQFVGHDITEGKQAEIDLKESEQRLADIINFLPDPTFAIDKKGRLITWNRAVEETTGVLSQDILGKGNYEYALKFYEERKPILIDLLLITS